MPGVLAFGARGFLQAAGDSPNRHTCYPSVGGSGFWRPRWEKIWRAGDTRGIHWLRAAVPLPADVPRLFSIPW